MRDASPQHPRRALRGLPVYYVFFAPSGHIPIAHYSWSVMRLTASYGNPLVLLTHGEVVAPPDVAGCVRRGDVRQLENTSAIRQLRAVYASGSRVAQAHLGVLREPEERYNLERYLVMHEHMRRTHVRAAMLLDSDAALVAPNHVLGVA
jgi:hypothetical protein